MKTFNLFYIFKIIIENTYTYMLILILLIDCNFTVVAFYLDGKYNNNKGSKIISEPFLKLDFIRFRNFGTTALSGHITFSLCVNIYKYFVEISHL